MIEEYYKESNKKPSTYEEVDYIKKAVSSFFVALLYVLLREYTPADISLLVSMKVTEYWFTGVVESYNYIFKS